MISTDKGLIIVAYAVAPGPGGPEAHVNRRLIEALAAHWDAPIDVITAGDTPVVRPPATGILHSLRWHHVSDLDPFSDQCVNPLVRLTARWLLSARMKRDLRSFLPRLISRLLLLAGREGVKMTFWETAARRCLKEILKEDPRRIVYSRALPFSSIAACMLALGRRQRWIVNINDPMPPDIGPQLYTYEPAIARRMHAIMKKVVKQIDAISFPCRRLMDLELSHFPDMRLLPRAIIPHITVDTSVVHTSNIIENKVCNIAFAGTLRQGRVADTFYKALSEYCRIHGKDEVCFSFHLARRNAFGEAFIHSLPVNVSITVEQHESDLHATLLAADVLLDLESMDDQPLLLTKLANYIGYGKAIWVIGAPGGTAEELLQREQFGYFSDVRADDSILETLVKIQEEHTNGVLARRGPSIGTMERFSRATQVRALRDLASAAERGVTELMTPAWP